MTPKDSHDNTHEDACAVRLGGHSPLVNVGREPSNQKDSSSVKATVKDMEAKILEKVSMLTISTTEEEEEEAATEVSFTADDLTGLTMTTESSANYCAAPASHGMTLTPSPILPRFKRSASSLTTPNGSYETPLPSSTFGPRRKKRRVPGTLADAPRLPFDNTLDSSPFTIYDQRLKKLVSRLMTNDVPVSPPSPIQLSGSDDDTIALPPVVSWMKPRTSLRLRNGRRRHHRTSFPILSPRQHELTPLESLALEIEASPIVMPVFP